MDGLSNKAKGTYLQQQGISPVGQHKTLNDRFKQSQKASKLMAPKPKSAKTELLAAWNKAERTSKLKYIEDIPYPSQKIADKPSARQGRTGEVVNQLLSQPCKPYEKEGINGKTTEGRSRERGARRE